MQGYKHRKAYIATQFPLSNTMSDFWRMVWEHQCSSIILLCDTNDNDMVYMIWRLAIQSMKGDRNGKSAKRNATRYSGVVSPSLPISFFHVNIGTGIHMIIHYNCTLGSIFLHSF